MEGAKVRREYAKVRRCKHTAEQRRDSGESHGMGERGWGKEREKWEAKKKHLAEKVIEREPNAVLGLDSKTKKYGKKIYLKGKFFCRSAIVAL